MDLDAIRKIIDNTRAGGPLPPAELVPLACSHCDTPMGQRRVSWGLDSRVFCGQRCYYAYRRNPKFIQSRHGTRKARALVAKVFALRPEHVVDHRDGDERNNNIGNLRVYASQSDHMKMHHGKSCVDPLWDGAEH